jgi:hypothetical protein
MDGRRCSHRLDVLVPIHVTADTLNTVIHALLVGGIVAVRYLWPLWVVIIALWLITRCMRALSRFLGFSGAPGKPAKPITRPRR